MFASSYGPSSAVNMVFMNLILSCNIPKLSMKTGKQYSYLPDPSRFQDFAISGVNCGLLFLPCVSYLHTDAVL